MPKFTEEDNKEMAQKWSGADHQKKAVSIVIDQGIWKLFRIWCREQDISSSNGLENLLAWYNIMIEQCKADDILTMPEGDRHKLVKIPEDEEDEPIDPEEVPERYRK